MKVSGIHFYRHNFFPPNVQRPVCLAKSCCVGVMTYDHLLAFTGVLSFQKCIGRRCSQLLQVGLVKVIS